jgi:hypothetical protein
VIQDPHVECECVADYETKSVEGGDDQEIVGTIKSFVETVYPCVYTCGDEQVRKVQENPFCDLFLLSEDLS